MPPKSKKWRKKPIQQHDDHCCLNFIPKNAFAQNIIQSFNDESTADMVFEVKRQDESGRLLCSTLTNKSCNYLQKVQPWLL